MQKLILAGDGVQEDIVVCWMAEKSGSVALRHRPTPREPRHRQPNSGESTSSERAIIKGSPFNAQSDESCGEVRTSGGIEDTFSKLHGSIMTMLPNFCNVGVSGTAAFEARIRNS
ncbi:hypothetical protein [Novosphingobium mangrovi (ex Huang et al. 2023)]|uniref:Uncharacterized protein n=1 Tax=Novosphingobium mangrovi (ex Huang et al. 2023) TaxID=2976432 RepID=A0ABT2I1J2_9SPHN|nr:hypothetical protein [Novosphingobium mangrovi (ex Huang et al. 2023)]MCT2398678.1 hypothetical protein [Novosphingobium mangrovi (ex Huang et al. 2023)]